MPNDKFSFRARIKSFSFAFAGVALFFRTEHNARVHLSAGICAFLLCWVLGLSRMETLAVVFVVGLVWVTEMINTSIEKMMDFVSKEKKEEIRVIKDLAAGAVLIASMCALTTGGFVFIPRLIEIYKNHVS